MKHSETIELLKTFLLATEQTRVAIRQSTAALNKAKGMGGFIQISRSPLSPVHIADKLKADCLPFLALSPETLSKFGGDPIDLQLAQDFIKEDIQPKLDLASHDWGNLFPKEMSYSDSFNYIAEHSDDIAETFTIVSAAYDFALHELHDTVIMNTAFILDDLGVRIK
jgi:hypothetical protein